MMPDSNLVLNHCDCYIFQLLQRECNLARDYSQSLIWPLDVLGENMDVSVVITSHNQSELISEAIDSVLNQTYDPYEIIVVDDGSADGSSEIVRQYGEEYEVITPIYHEDSQGIPKTFNAGFREATGDAVTVLAGDDRFYPNKLEEEVKALQNSKPQVKIAFSNFHLTDTEGDVISVWDKNGSVPKGDIFLETINRSFPNNTLFRNELIEYSVIESVGLFDEELTIYEDWDFKIRATAEFEAAYCPEPNIEYRQHPEGISKRTEKSLHLDCIQTVFKNNEYIIENKLPPTEAAEAKYNLQREIARLKALSAVEDRRIRDAISHYLTYVQHYEGGTDLTFQLEFFLTKRMFKIVRDLYNRIR